MICPKCSAHLNVSHREGVEIDVCPACRGVWLDRGELDKIIDRYDTYDREDERERYEEYRRREQRQPKRRSFWHEIFD